MLFVWVMVVVSCNIINPDETIPTRIQVDPFQFNVEPGQGSAQNEITEVWVYANSSFLGAFDMPVTINYLEEGDTEFTFRPGIRNNGILLDAIIYPMFSGYSTHLNAEAGANFSVSPVTSYTSEVIFSMIADFETNNIFLDNRDTVAASNMVRSSEEVFEGSFSGEIVMSEEAYFIEIGNAVALTDLPTDGTSTYLELRYKSEAEMSIGLLGIELDGDEFSNFFYLVYPSEEWNMLYIELTEHLQVSDFPAYKILFRSLYPAGATEPEYRIYLDNIKVVHLPE